MSYEMVKSASVRKAEDGTYYALICGHSSNTYPRRYHSFKCMEGSKTKEEVQCAMLSDFVRGNMRGQSRFADFVRSVEAGLATSKAIARYNRLYHLHNETWKLWGECRDRKDEAGMKRYNKLENYLWNRAIAALEATIVADYAAWRPDSRRYRISIKNNGYVTSVGERRFRFQRVADEAKARKFSAITAAEFCKKFANYSPVKVEVREDGQQQVKAAA